MALKAGQLFRVLKIGQKVKKGDYCDAWKGSKIMVPAKDLLGCKLTSKDPMHYRPVKRKS